MVETYFHNAHEDFIQAITKLTNALEGKYWSRLADLLMMPEFTHTGDIGIDNGHIFFDNPYCECIGAIEQSPQ